MEDIAFAGAIPNMQIIAPCDPAEVAEATRWCARQRNGPVYLRLGKSGEPDLTKAAEPWVFGKLRCLRAARISASSLTASSRKWRPN
jgi:transketolase